METKKYKIIGKIEIVTEEGKGTGKFLAKNSIHEIPEELGSKWVENGDAILVEDKLDKDEEKTDATEIKVYNKDNQVVRVYSKAVHGKNFIKLAKEFTVKKGYSLK